MNNIDPLKLRNRFYLRLKRNARFYEINEKLRVRAPACRL